MTSDLNPYQAWLGLASPQPPNHYELLGLPLYECDAAAVARAAADRRANVMSQLDGPHAGLANKLLGEIYVAEHFLKDAAQRTAYDEKLKSALAANGASDNSDDSDESPAMRPEDFLPPAATPASLAPAATAATPTSPHGQPLAARPVAAPYLPAGAASPLGPYASSPYGYTPTAHPTAVAQPGAVYAATPHAAAPYGTAPHGAQTHGTQPYGLQHYGTPPYGTPYGASPYAAPTAVVPVARVLPTAPPVAPQYYPSQTDAAAANHYAGWASQTIAAEPLFPQASGASFAQPAPLAHVGGAPLTNTETASAEMDGLMPPAAAPEAFVASAPAAARFAADAAPRAFAPPASAPLAAVPTAAAALPGAAHQDAPVAAIPASSAAQAASPATASVAARPISVTPAAATPAISADKRPRAAGKKATPIWIAAGVPAALVVMIGLVILYATGTGPFSKSADDVAAKSPGGEKAPELHAPPVQPDVSDVDQPEPNPSVSPETEPADTEDGDNDPDTADPEAADPEMLEPGGNIPGVTDPPMTSPDEPASDPPTTSTDPPSTDPPTTDPPTTTTDPPATDPPPTDPPTTNPPSTAPTELSESDLARVTYHLSSARYHLAQRDVAEAKLQIASAQEIDTIGTTHKEIDRVKTLSFYVEEFWKAAKAQVDGTPLNNTMKLKGKNGGIVEIILVEKYDDGLLVKQSGANRNYKYASMPSGLAIGLADTWLNADPNSDLILGAFLCVNPTSDKDEARQRWQAAAAAGTPDIKTNVELLLPELEIKYPAQLGEPPAVASSDPAEEPLPGQSLPTQPMPAGEPSPSEDGRFPALVGSELKEAEASFQEQYQEQLAAAPFDSDKAELARTLLTDAAAEGIDPSSQFVLLDQARQMASTGGDFNLALEAVDLLAAKFAIDVEQSKVDILAEAVKKAETPEANADLTRLGMKLAQDFALALRYDQALRAARWAKTTAGKAKDTDLLKEANELYTLIDEEKKNAE